MRTRVWTALLVATVFVVVAFGPWLTSAQDKAQSRTKWEYKIVQIAAAQGGVPMGSATVRAIVPGTIAEKELTALGEEGWELFKIADALPVPRNDSFTPTVYYFRRPK